MNLNSIKLGAQRYRVLLVGIGMFLFGMFYAPIHVLLLRAIIGIGYNPETAAGPVNVVVNTIIFTSMMTPIATPLLLIAGAVVAFCGFWTAEHRKNDATTDDSTPVES